MTFAHEDGDEIRLQHEPAVAIALCEKRIAGLVGIVGAKVTNEALVIVIFVALVVWQPPIVLFAGFVAYALSGYAVTAWQAMRKRRAAPSN